MEDFSATNSYTTLTTEQWSKVAELSAQNEISMFILRSWANMGYCESGSINALKGKIENITANDKKDMIGASSQITQITKAIQKATGRDESRCYLWNRRARRWSIGYYNFCNLRLAMDPTVEADPDK
jgi:aerobic-type carbon monoxide dehydrogenase small subunit (CoxS/CutS family)